MMKECGERCTQKKRGYLERCRNKLSYRGRNGATDTEGWIEAVVQTERKNNERLGGKRNTGMSWVSEEREI